MKFIETRPGQVLLLVAVAFLFGSSFILIKRTLEVFNAMQVAAVRMVVAWVFFLPLIIRYRHKLSWRNSPYLLVVGIVGNALPSFLFAWAQTEITSALAGMINTFMPLFTVLLGIILFGVRVGAQRWAGVLIGLAGALGLLYNGGADYFSGKNYYALWAALGIACIALSTNVVKFRLGQLSGTAVAALAFAFVGPLALAYLAISGFGGIAPYPAPWWPVYPVLLGLTASFLPVIGINTLVQHTTPILSSMVTYLIPLVAIFWGIMDGESIAWRQLMFIAVTLAGVSIVLRASKYSKGT